mmetsp:Transcript_21237/g.60625  ORF Transcript_21237/g.60625 Transcript_21237/m.60625 type:complete len:305 (+) Transcript_21237:258-1172(+)
MRALSAGGCSQMDTSILTLLMVEASSSSQRLAPSIGLRCHRFKSGELSTIISSCRSTTAVASRVASATLCSRCSCFSCALDARRTSVTSFMKPYSNAPCGCSFLPPHRNHRTWPSALSYMISISKGCPSSAHLTMACSILSRSDGTTCDVQNPAKQGKLVVAGASSPTAAVTPAPASLSGLGRLADGAVDASSRTATTSTISPFLSGCTHCSTHTPLLSSRPLLALPSSRLATALPLFFLQQHVHLKSDKMRDQHAARRSCADANEGRDSGVPEGEDRGWLTDSAGLSSLVGGRPVNAAITLVW